MSGLFHIRCKVSNDVDGYCLAATSAEQVESDDVCRGGGGDKIPYDGKIESPSACHEYLPPPPPLPTGVGDEIAP